MIGMQHLLRRLFDLRVSWRSALIFAGGYLLLTALWMLLLPPDSPAYPVLSALAIFVAALSAGLCMLCERRLAARALMRNWNYITTAGLLFAVAGFVFLILSTAGVYNTPNLADVPRLAAYPALLIGLLSYPLLPRQRFGQLRMLMDIVLGVLAVLALGWYIFLQPVFVAEGFTAGEAFWLIVFPFFDLVLLMILLNVTLVTRPSAMRQALGWLVLGVLGLAVADLALVYRAVSIQMLRGSPAELARVFAYAAFALAALYLQTHPKEPPLSSPRMLQRYRISRRTQELLPLFTTLAILWFTLADLATNTHFNPLLVGISFLIGVGLIARQGIVAGEIELREYAYLVESAAEAAFICDVRGRFLLVNPALVNAVGYEQETDLLGGRLWMLMPPETSPQLLEEALKSGYSGETMLRRRDGSSFPVQLSLQPVERQIGNRPVLAGTAHDLTEQKRQQAELQAAFEEVAAARAALQEWNLQLEVKVEEKTRSLSEAYAQLEQQNRTLQQLDELKSDFVSLVSHELRAPLTNISGGIELISGNAGLDASTHHSLALVQMEIRRLTHFVETILDLSALDAGRIPFYPEPLSLPAIAGVLLPQFRAMPGAERIRWNIPQSLPAVLADERALISIFFHLVDNALKYAPQGEVKISAREENGRVVVSVADSGPGIAPDALPLLFQKFYRANNEDAQSIYGHGLGLYIVQRLLEALHGEITAENLTEGGACFSFWLPRVEE